MYSRSCSKLKITSARLLRLQIRSQLTLLMIYFPSIILNRVECNCLVCWYAEKYDFVLGAESKKSEVHKLSFPPAAYLPLLYRLSSSKLSYVQSANSIILTFEKMAQHKAVAFY